MIDNYKNLKKIKIKNTIPNTYFPKPTELDYRRKFITRYFTQRRDTPGSPIFEINEDSFGGFYIHDIGRDRSRWD